MKGHRGYSNYYKALTDFNEEYFKNVDKNTIIIFFGDARNNKNDTGIEYIKSLKEKCKSIIWLNPEEKRKLNATDSIIGKYEPYIDNLYEVLDVKDLIDFMENFSLKRKAI